MVAESRLSCVLNLPSAHTIGGQRLVVLKVNRIEMVKIQDSCHLTSIEIRFFQSTSKAMVQFCSIVLAMMNKTASMLLVL